MRISYDPRNNIAYIRFADKRSDVEAVPVGDSLIVDLAADGTVYGIELLNANEQLREHDLGRLLLVNEASGETAEILLPLG